MYAICGPEIQARGVNTGTVLSTKEMELHEIDLGIRALTVILSKLRPQASLPTRSDSSTELTIATHIATLLTRSRESKSEGRAEPSIRHIAVTARTASQSVEVFAASNGGDLFTAPNATRSISAHSITSATLDRAALENFFEL